MLRNKSNLSKTGTVYWITGLSGSGKTTLCKRLSEYLLKRHKKVIKLDGDELRKVLDKKDSHTRDERLKIAMIYARLAKMLSNQGYDVVNGIHSLTGSILCLPLCRYSQYSLTPPFSIA